MKIDDLEIGSLKINSIGHVVCDMVQEGELIETEYNDDSVTIVTDKGEIRLHENTLLSLLSGMMKSKDMYGKFFFVMSQIVDHLDGLGHRELSNELISPVESELKSKIVDMFNSGTHIRDIMSYVESQV